VHLIVVHNFDIVYWLHPSRYSLVSTFLSFEPTVVLVLLQFDAGTLMFVMYQLAIINLFTLVLK